MNAGKLRHRLIIQKRGEDQGAYGAMVETWEQVAVIWAAIEPLQGREFIAAQSTQSETTGKIRIRYRSDVTTAMRGVFGEKIYNFLSIINQDQRNRELIIYTSEGLNEG